MRIELNGTPVVTGSATLDALVKEQGFEAESVATAVNGGFVPRHARAETVLSHGAKVEVLSPMQGG